MGFRLTGILYTHIQVISIESKITLSIESNITLSKGKREIALPKRVYPRICIVSNIKKSLTDHIAILDKVCNY